MSTQSIFVIISSALAFIASLIYARAVLQGDVKPHRTTWFVILLITVLSTSSLFAQHDRVAVYLAAVSALQAILIFSLCIKRGMGGWARTDILCLAIALTGIMLWKTTNNPALALYCSIGADFAGMVPAVIKTYHHPKTEIYVFYLLDVIAATFTMLALNQWRIQDFSYPIYIFLINLCMVILIIRPKKT